MEVRKPDRRLPGYLSAEQLAEYLNVSRPHIYVMCKAGVLPQPIHLGRSARWKLTDVQRYLSNQKRNVK